MRVLFVETPTLVKNIAACPWMTVEAFAEFAGAEFGLPLKTLDFSVQGARFVEEGKEVGKRGTGTLTARTIADLDIKHAPILMALSASRIARSLPPVADADVARPVSGRSVCGVDPGVRQPAPHERIWPK